jgi:hypothetical protein
MVTTLTSLTINMLITGSYTSISTLLSRATSLRYLDLTIGSKSNILHLCNPLPIWYLPLSLETLSLDIPVLPQLHYLSQQNPIIPINNNNNDSASSSSLLSSVVSSHPSLIIPSFKNIRVVLTHNIEHALMNLLRDLHDLPLTVSIVDDRDRQFGLGDAYYNTIDTKMIPPSIKWTHLSFPITSIYQLSIISLNMKSLRGLVLSYCIFPSFDVIGQLMKSVPLLTDLNLWSCDIMTSHNHDGDDERKDEKNTMVDLGSLSRPLKEGEIIEMKELKELSLFGINQTLASSLILPKLKQLSTRWYKQKDDINEEKGVDMTHLLMNASLSLQQLSLYTGFPWTLHQSLDTPLLLALPTLTSLTISSVFNIPSFIALLRSCPILTTLELNLPWTKRIIDSLHTHTHTHIAGDKTKMRTVLPLTLCSLNLVSNTTAISIDDIDLIIDIIRPLLRLTHLNLHFSQQPRQHHHHTDDNETDDPNGNHNNSNDPLTTTITRRRINGFLGDCSTIRDYLESRLPHLKQHHSNITVGSINNPVVD